MACALLFADDATLCALSADQLQGLFNHFFNSYAKFDLTISVMKTVTMSQSSDTCNFTIDDKTFKDVEKVT